MKLNELFENLRVYGGSWEIVERVKATELMGKNYPEGEVVAGEYGKSMRFKDTSKSTSEYKYIPLSTDSKLEVGDKRATSSLEVLGLERDGDFIMRVVELLSY